VNGNGIHGSIICVGRHQSHALDNCHTGIDTTKDGVMSIQKWGRFQRDKELTPIGIGRIGIGHAAHTGPGVLEMRTDLVFKHAAVVDGNSTSAGPGGITALDHKVPNHSVEYGVIVISRMCQCGNVVTGPGGVFVVQFHNKRPLQNKCVCPFSSFRFRPDSDREAHGHQDHQKKRKDGKKRDHQEIDYGTCACLRERNYCRADSSRPPFCVPRLVPSLSIDCHSAADEGKEKQAPARRPTNKSIYDEDATTYNGRFKLNVRPWRWYCR
jgi:hypothetical protein